MVPTNRRRESSRVTSSLGRCLVYIDQTFDKECHIYNFFKRIAFIIGSILSYLMRHLAWTTRTLPYFTFRRSFLTLLSMCRLFERLQAVVSLEVSREFTEFVNLQKSWKIRHFSPRHTKWRISQDNCCIRTTNIETPMTIFRHCHNVWRKYE